MDSDDTWGLGIASLPRGSKVVPFRFGPIFLVGTIIAILPKKELHLSLWVVNRMSVMFELRATPQCRLKMFGFKVALLGPL